MNDMIAWSFVFLKISNSLSLLWGCWLESSL